MKKDVPKYALLSGSALSTMLALAVLFEPHQSARCGFVTRAAP